MINNKENLKRLEMILVFVVLAFVIISALDNFSTSLSENNITFSANNILTIIGYFVGSILSGIFSNFSLVLILIAVMLASRKLYRRRLDETDFEKNKEYYRDIIKDYSISELNYIDKFKLEKKQAYTAKLLELEKKKIIKIANGKINIIGEAKDKIDKAFVASIKDNKVTLSLSEYENLVISEALDKELIVAPNGLGMFKDVKGLIFLIALLIFGSDIIFFIAFNGNLDVFLEKYFLVFVLGIFAFSYLTIFGFIYFFTLIVKSGVEPQYKRTKKGQEINLQLDGLKLFMEEFSNINDKESQHLILWEDYLVYSVMFDINKNIQNEYAKYFDI